MASEFLQFTDVLGEAVLAPPLWYALGMGLLVSLLDDRWMDVLLALAAAAMLLAWTQLTESAAVAWASFATPSLALVFVLRVWSERRKFAVRFRRWRRGDRPLTFS